MIHVTAADTKYTCERADVTADSQTQKFIVEMVDVKRIQGAPASAIEVQVMTSEPPEFEVAPEVRADR